MNVRKFVAPSSREALRLVKLALGPDAVILANRNVAEGVEIMAVAAGDIAMVAGPARESAAAPRAAGAAIAPFADADDDYSVSLSGASRRGEAAPLPRLPSSAASTAPVRASGAAPAATRATPDPVPRQSRAPVDFSRAPAAVGTRELPPAASVVPSAVMDELRALRQMVEQQLAGFAWRDMVRQDPVRGTLVRQMLDGGFSPAYARRLVADVPAGLDDRAAVDWAQDRVARALRASGDGEDLMDRGGVFALVGPTGVGKTTTAAKLAARCVLRHGASRVALITSDGYRIGAHEQLRIYGRILGVPVHGVRDGLELKSALRDLAGKHMVIIDTMGMSQRDRNVAGQSAMLEDAGVERLLLLSATSRADTLDDVVRAYAPGGLAGCIVSKVDEAVGIASAIDVVIRHGLRLRYVSNGQRVPEDLHLPNALYLAHRAFKAMPEDSPHRHRDTEPALVMGNAGEYAAFGAARA